MTTLSPRLQTVANCVRFGSRLLDVGTDHAQLPVFLVESGRCPVALATDLREGPCARARAAVELAGLTHRITVRQTDGVSGVDLTQVDDIVLAGMGGKLILRLLNRSELRSGRLRLILQPQTDVAEVRGALHRWGYGLEEHLAREGQKIYHVLCAQIGAPQSATEQDLLFGRPVAAEDLLFAYYTGQEQRLRRQLRGIASARAPDDTRLRQIEQALAELAKRKEELDDNKS